MYSSDMEDKDFILALIISDISDDITEEERVLLKKKLAESKDAQNLYNETYDLLMSKEAEKGRAQLSNYAPVFIKAKHPVRRILDRYYIGVSVAALFIVFLSVFIINRHRESNHISKVVIPSRDSIQLALDNGTILNMGKYDMTVVGPVNENYGSAFTYHLEQNAGKTGVLYVPAGKFYQLILSDGTSVMINAATKVTFPLTFGDTREISLSGNADIEVAQNSNKPFLVHLPNSVIQVLGTRFRASTYDGKEGVSLMSGKVEYIKGKDTMMLDPGEEVFTLPGLSMKKNSFIIDDMENGIYRCENVISMEELAGLIRKYFRMDVKISKLRQNIQFHGIIEYNKPVTVLLETLKRIYGVEYTTTSNTIQIN
ncbi:FecR family protein [Chitinophaga sp. YR573]|uniref:FecR family protein n=1 Tax=Chitinophaga sp. YR573 TaxID=1881040 RepID=UPI0008BFE372|nr:FecR family protein [Chitinophaga sp. YR573]SEW44162.1 FecR family protein [Chitinophaga sp. YR573]